MGDYSNLDEEDIRILKEWLAGVQIVGFRVVIGDTEHYFSSCPEFGLPCEVVDSSLVKVQKSCKG